MKNSNAIPNFLHIFEQRLDKMKKEIKEELDKPKKERSKNVLKKLVSRANALKKSIKEAKKSMSVDEKKCPHCGKKID